MCQFHTIKYAKKDCAWAKSLGNSCLHKEQHIWYYYWQGSIDLDCQSCYVHAEYTINPVNTLLTSNLYDDVYKRGAKTTQVPRTCHWYSSCTETLELSPYQHKRNEPGHLYHAHHFLHTLLQHHAPDHDAISGYGCVNAALEIHFNKGSKVGLNSD